MAMFDIGKRGTGADTERDVTAEPESAPRRPEEPTMERQPVGGVRRRDAAVVGPSIHIDGTLKGEEDLIIEGHVTGTVQLQDHSLTIGPNGRVEADLYANVVNVEGVVEGDLYGSDRVAVRSSARVKGNITAPRVSLEDGAWFKGSIEMDPAAVDGVLGTKSRSAPATEPRGGQTAEATGKGSGSSAAAQSGKTESGSKESGSAQAEGSGKSATGEQSSKASGASGASS